MATVNTKGLRDWILQRITSVFIGVYALATLGYLLFAKPLDFAAWQAAHQHIGVKIFTLLVLLSVLIHAWIGLWTVFTDYVKNIPLRFILEIIVGLLLIAYVVWGIDILWG